MQEKLYGMWNVGWNAFVDHIFGSKEEIEIRLRKYIDFGGYKEGEIVLAEITSECPMKEITKWGVYSNKSRKTVSLCYSTHEEAVKEARYLTHFNRDSYQVISFTVKE